jgi:hypothetical protein
MADLLDQISGTDSGPSGDLLDQIAGQTSAGGAFGRAAATSVVPSFGAWGGAEAGAGIGAAIPVLGETGIGELGGALIGAVVGSLLANKAQNEVIKTAAPNTYATLQKYQQEDLKDHPVATALGNLAGGLPAFRFGNPVQTARGAAAIYKIATGAATTDAEKLAAKGLATQLGVGTAGGVVAPLIQGQKPTAGELTQSIAQTLLFGSARFGGKVPSGVTDVRTESEDQNASSQRKATGSNGNSGTSPGAAIQPQQGTGQNVPQTTPRIRQNEGVEETQAQPQPEPLSPARGGGTGSPQGNVWLKPALLVDGKPFTGGKTHAEIFQNIVSHPNVTGKMLERISDALSDDSKHVFVDNNGNVFTRKEGQQMFEAAGGKVSDPKLGLTSEDLLAQPDVARNMKAPQTITGVSNIEKMSPDEFVKWTQTRPGGLTGEAWRIGQAVKTPEDIAALQNNIPVLRMEMKRLQAAGDLKGAMGEAQKIQFFNEAYGAATGTGSAGNHLRENLPGYEPPSEKMAAEPPKPETPGSASKTGVGAMRAGELGEPGNPDVMGVRQVTREAQEKAGLPVVAEPGEGRRMETTLDEGRAALVRDPLAADKAAAEFRKSGRFSYPDFTVVRAKYEKVMAQARQVEQKYGTSSPEYEAARQEAFKWSEVSKDMQTEWHKTGMAQQGETDIDTGSVIGLENEYHDNTGKTFDKDQTKKAGEISGKVRGKQGEVDNAKKNLNKTLATSRVNQNKAGRLAIQNSAQRIINRFAKVQKDTPQLRPGQKDPLEEAVSQQIQERGPDDVFQNKLIQLGVNEDDARVITMMTRKEIQNRDVIAGPEAMAWRKVKEYLDQGETDFDDIRHKVAADMGLPVDRVTEMLSKNKEVKRAADDVWKRQQELRRLKEQAKAWVQEQATPGYVRALSKIPKTLFGLKVGFHGTVALGTHAPAVAFQPNFWGTYVKNFIRMYKMVGSAAYYERQMQDLVRRGNFLTARRAGLVNDPFQYEDYNDPNVTAYSRYMLAPGQRGYSVLKTLRQDMFDQHWNTLPKEAQTPEVAKAIADGINHATGVVKGRAPTGSNIALFAPRLGASRVAWLAVDPVKAAGTFLNWSAATPEAKIFAVNQAKEKAYVAGTLLSMLAFNQAMLSLVGSKQKINVTNPMQSDWLKFKVAGMNLAYGNAMVTMARLPARLWQIRESSGGKLRKLIYPDENTYSALGEYARSQLSPFASLLSTLWLKADWQNRPLPNSTQPVPKRLRAQGVQPYTWKEFGLEQVAPIPFEEAIREVFQGGFHLDAAEVKKAEKALATIAVMSATGARLTDDVQANKQGNFVWNPMQPPAQANTNPLSE